MTLSVHQKNRSGTCLPAQSQKNRKSVYALVLIGLFLVFMFAYRRSCIFPQQGWWQYYAWRMTEGDILYKDLYLFIPPYYPMMTAILFRLFSVDVFFYSLFVGLPFRIITLLILYTVLCRKTKPAYACIAVFFGECFNQSYKTYLLYDYNPIGTAFAVLLAYAMLRFYETSDRRAEAYSFFSGLLCGILLMFKQTMGLVLTAAVVVMLFVLLIRQKRANWLRISFLYFFGCFDGLLPAVFYFVRYDCFRDFLHCLLLANSAKGGSDGLISHFLGILSEAQYWVTAALIFILGAVCKKAWPESFEADGSASVLINRGMGRKRLLSAAIPFLAFLCALCLSGKESTYSRLLFAIVFLYADLILLTALFLDDEAGRARSALVLIAFSAMILWIFLPGSMVSGLYESSSYWSVHHYLIYVFSYLMLLLWAVALIKYFSSPGIGYSCLIFLTVTGFQFLVGLISAEDLEPWLMVLVIPWGAVFLLEINCPGKALKNLALTAAMLIFTLMILSQKMTVPYDWQGWRSQPVQNNISIQAEGLEEYRSDPESAASFEEITSLIKKHTDPEDTVYSFANIPLFNFLSLRKMPTYMPIHWFDVCPDTVAEEDCKRLLQDPPQIVIWHNMSEGEWDKLESVFRNGDRSGQRAIKEDFYEDYVKERYTLLGEYDNHRDGTIQIWLKNH